MSPGLQLLNIQAGYGGKPVLRDISFEIARGKVLALLGPSGCGKTTLLRVVAGLIEPESGEVRIHGRSMQGVVAERREAAAVFQKPLLFPHMTVAKNLAFGLTIRGVPKDEIAKRVADVLGLMQLEGLENRRPHELSGGQEQRVSLARALVIRPQLLLLDEPFAALDESLRGEMRDLLRNVQRSTGVTTLFVTHDQQEAAQVADEIGLLLDGMLAQRGGIRDFVEDPASEAVARFFGWQLFGAEGMYVRPQRLSFTDPGGEVVELTGGVEECFDLGTHVVTRVRTERGLRVEVHGACAPSVEVGRRVQVFARACDVRRF